MVLKIGQKRQDHQEQWPQQSCGLEIGGNSGPSLQTNDLVRAVVLKIGQEGDHNLDQRYRQCGARPEAL